MDKKGMQMGKSVKIQPDGRRLSEILLGQFCELPSFCGGRGTCGKCKVLVKKEENSEGEVVLACQYVPFETCLAEILQEDEEFLVEVGVGELTQRWGKKKGKIVVDIGTTTIAMLLLNGTGETLFSWTGLNPQRRYGADVISRVERAGKGQEQELTYCIRQEILIGMESLCEFWEARIQEEEREGEREKEKGIDLVVIAGNTTMQHLFAGYSVEGMGSYPFSVVQKDLVVGKLAEFYPVLPKWLIGAEYRLMPCVSAFIGGDILAGVLEIEWMQMKKKEELKSWLLLDIGTNGEMVLYAEGVYYAASTAAGPVFEGGNISCGIGSVAGAIDHVWERNGELEYSTIGEKPALGICGTGLIESVAVLLKMGILDRDGFLTGYTKEGYVLARGRDGALIRITQEDIRQFQLAKAAIRAGMEILCRTAKVAIREIGKIYLAGGFGTKLDVKKSCAVGLLPAISGNRYCVLGNASLGGGRTFCIGKNMEEHLKRIQQSSREVTLALEGEFQKQYIEYMRF